MIVVIGTGRSGTSLVAGILSNLGVNMGEKMLGPGPSNPTGHFEDLDFIELNDKILASAGGAADNPPLESVLLSLAPMYNYSIASLISSRSGLWGWKDPRTSITFKLFLPHLKDPKIIFVDRNHDDTVRSLWNRDRWRGYKPTDKLVTEVARRIDGIKQLGLDNITVDYDTLRKEAVSEVARIANFVGVASNEVATSLVLSPKDLAVAKSKW